MFNHEQNLIEIKDYLNGLDISFEMSNIDTYYNEESVFILNERYSTY